MSIALHVAVWPRDVIAVCAECPKPIRVGQPYRMVRPGVFAHRLHAVNRLVAAARGPAA